MPAHDGSKSSEMQDRQCPPNQARAAQAMQQMMDQASKGGGAPGGASCALSIYIYVAALHIFAVSLWWHCVQGSFVWPVVVSYRMAVCACVCASSHGGITCTACCWPSHRAAVQELAPVSAGPGRSRQGFRARAAFRLASPGLAAPAVVAVAPSRRLTPPQSLQARPPVLTRTLPEAMTDGGDGRQFY